jgi:hypothetical protein
MGRAPIGDGHKKARKYTKEAIQFFSGISRMGVGLAVHGLVGRS